MHKLREPNRAITTGLLLVSGLAILFAFILLLSVSPDLFQPGFRIILQLSDASGVSKDSDVSLSGAVIGKVVSYPHVVPGTSRVEITLKIDRGIKIRKDAQFSIESSGFFGDKFVNVRPESNLPGEDKVPYLQNGDIVQGLQAPDLSTLVASSLPLIHRATRVADQLDGMVTRLNTDILTPKTMAELKESAVKISSIKNKSKALATNAHDLTAGLKNGDGVLGKLFCDKSVRRNLKDFVASYRAHGAIFYSDNSARPPKHVRSRPPWRARP